MRDDSVRFLNELNKQFYTKNARSFSVSRSNAWPGWSQFETYIKNLTSAKSSFSVLDVGCGNGRFCSFLTKLLSGIQINYCGIDASANLLRDAKDTLIQPNISANFIELDVVETLLTDQFHEQLSSKTPYQLITALAVFHHIPSLKLRQKLITKLVDLLSPGGLLIISAWQFQNSIEQLQRAKQPSRLTQLPNDSEPNDYLLDWETKENSLRYCHLIDQNELNQLITTPKLKTLATFAADGRDQTSNLYTICQRQ